MQENMVEKITKDILKDIGIHAVGDILLTLRHAKSCQAYKGDGDFTKVCRCLQCRYGRVGDADPVGETVQVV
ncbi:hypothetical protein OS493_032518 [Desmophyllum pertusum]|uniref:Uncharacterized protein n=1 Tax=Desmophyllum pertusum TaxID=174260 RepID=A0A9X0CX82_9CNID|nr:hypothetical protein OS493_032518 [Desmophyllum pertusum]